MIQYNNSLIMNSELAVQILSEIATEGNEDYSSNIAHKLDKRQSSISRILTEMKEAGFLNKCERERAQYYEINYDNIADFWHETLQKELSQSENISEESESLKQLEKHGEKSKKVFKKFMANLLESEKDLSNFTFSKLLFDSFTCSLVHKLKEDKNYLRKRPELLYPVVATVFVREKKDFPNELDKALKETI